MELVPTSNTPHPHAQPRTWPGASNPANKLQLTPIVTAELNLFFI
jgi:hypothetical protein